MAPSHHRNVLYSKKEKRGRKKSSQGATQKNMRKASRGAKNHQFLFRLFVKNLGTPGRGAPRGCRASPAPSPGPSTSDGDGSRGGLQGVAGDSQGSRGSLIWVFFGKARGPGPISRKKVGFASWVSPETRAPRGTKRAKSLAVGTKKRHPRKPHLV